MNKTLKKKSGDDAGDARTSRFEMRMSPYVRKVVKRAAELQGRTMSDFIAAAAEQAAEKAIRDAHIIELTIDEQLRFAEALLNPPELGSAWKRARESHRRLISESR